MQDKIIHFNYKNKELPMVFNLNVMEEIQEHYGSVAEWASKMDTKEPLIKDIKFGVLAMINEGIDIENEDREQKEPLLAAKQVGRIMTEVGLSEIIAKVMEITTKSTKVDDEEPKNM